MSQPETLDQKHPGKPKRYSWISAFTLWTFVSIAGWGLVAGAIYVISSDNSQNTAEEDAKDLQEIAPAAGPAQEQPQN